MSTITTEPLKKRVSKFVSAKTKYLREQAAETVSNKDSLRVVHCHQNNDPTLPMQMMVEMKLNSKIEAPEGFELIHEPNVWLRQDFYLNLYH